jgi:hypothetical protein
MSRVVPLVLHHAAERMGRLLGEGRVGIEMASACCDQWALEDVTGARVASLEGVKSAVCAAGPLAMSLAVAINQRMRDAAADWARERARAAAAIGWAVRPLFAAGASAAEIEEAAGRANGDVLEWDDVAAILGREMRQVRGRRWA